METTVMPVPDGIHTITPDMVVRGAARAADWYKRALGAEEKGYRIPVPGGKFIHIELRIGDSSIMLADEFPEFGILSPESVGNTSVVLAIATNDAKALWERATKAGATVLQPLADSFWGELHGQIGDPFGHRWNIGQQVRHVDPGEIEREAAKLFGG